jgi:hypothetical protein
MRSRRVVLLLTVLAAATGEASGAVVFEQPPDPRISAGISSPLGYRGEKPGRRTADDFTILADTRIIQIDWWGQHAPPSSGLDDYTFGLYTDADGLPGDLLLETRGNVVSMPNSQISNLTDYQAILDVPFDVSGGQRYWLSVFNASPKAAWRWNNSIIGNEASVQTFVPPDNEWHLVPGTDVDLSFRLVEIPEPATLLLLGMGLGLMRKRKQSAIAG